LEKSYKVLGVYILISTIILSAAIIFSALSHRFYSVNNNRLVLDSLTGKIYIAEVIDKSR
jgi:hypothetical protein